MFIIKIGNIHGVLYLKGCFTQLIITVNMNTQQQNKIEKLQHTINEWKQKEEDNSGLIAANHHQLADIYSEDDQYDKAAAHYLAAYLLWQTQNDVDEHKANLLFEISRAYFRNDELEEAEKYLDQAFAFANNNNRLQDLARLHHRKALVEITYNSLDEAVDELEKAIELADKHEQTETLGDSYASLGDISRMLNDHEQAIQDYSEAIHYYNQAQSYRRVALVYQTIGSIFFKFKKYAQSAKSFKQSADNFAREGNHDEQGVSYAQLAKIMESDGKHKEAIYYYEQSADCHVNAVNNYEAASSLVQAAVIAEGINDWALAEQQYSKALPLARATEDEILMGAVGDGLEKTAEKLSNKTAKKEKKGFFGKWF